MTLIVTGIDTWSDPDVPISWIVDVPRGALRAAVQLSVTFAVPFAGTVTGSVEAVADTPFGNELTPSVTAPVNPLTLVSVSVVLVLPPSRTVNEAGDKLIV